MHSPYQNDGLNSLYEMLFCDNPEAFEVNADSRNEHPWSLLFSESPDRDALLQLADDQNAESRIRALAANKLLQIGGEKPRPELLGVIVEVGLEEGLDVLAGFSDGTARYLNHAEKGIIWESPTDVSNGLINNLWQQSINVVNKIGPWDKARMAPPTAGMVRLNFLVSGQIFLGQGPMNVFFQDPMAGPVLNAALQLMNFLTETSLKN